MSVEENQSADSLDLVPVTLEMCCKLSPVLERVSLSGHGKRCGPPDYARHKHQL